MSTQLAAPKTSGCGQQSSGSCDLLDSDACNADNEGVFGQIWHRGDGGNAVHSWSGACLSFRLARGKVLKTVQGNASINHGDVRLDVELDLSNMAAGRYLLSFVILSPCWRVMAPATDCDYEPHKLEDHPPTGQKTYRILPETFCESYATRWMKGQTISHRRIIENG